MPRVFTGLKPGVNKNMTTIKIAPVKPNISMDVLERIDIRVGTIRLVEDVKGSDKLVKLTVDFGDQTRTILVGMKREREDPKQIEGRDAVCHKPRAEKDPRRGVGGHVAGHRIRRRNHTGSRPARN